MRRDRLVRTSAKEWRERRSKFAHRLGRQLIGETSVHPALSGPAVYSVWLSWGLLYVGQITDASRRLRRREPPFCQHVSAGDLGSGSRSRLASIARSARGAGTARPRNNQPRTGISPATASPTTGQHVTAHAGGWRTVDLRPLTAIPARSESTRIDTVSDDPAIIRVRWTLYRPAARAYD